MSEVRRWKLKGFIPGIEGETKAVFQPTVVLAEDYDAALAREAAERLRADVAVSDCNEAERREAALREELASSNQLINMWREQERLRCVQASESGKECDALQQRLTDAEKKLGEAYEWGYSDGQNCPNGYSDEKDRDKCVAELTKPAAEPEALGTRPVGCCCPPKGHTGIWAAAMCPVHFGLRRPKPSAEGEGS